MRSSLKGKGSSEDSRGIAVKRSWGATKNDGKVWRIGAVRGRQARGSVQAAELFAAAQEAELGPLVGIIPPSVTASGSRNRLGLRRENAVYVLKKHFHSEQGWEASGGRITE